MKEVDTSSVEVAMVWEEEASIAVATVRRTTVRLHLTWTVAAVPETGSVGKWIKGNK